MDESLDEDNGRKQRERYEEFNVEIDFIYLQFSFGMKFSNAYVFRKAIKEHAIKHQRGINLSRMIGLGLE